MNHDSVAGVYDGPDDKLYVDEHVTIKMYYVLYYIPFILYHRPDISTDDINMQACEVYGLSRFKNNTSRVNM